MKILLEEVVEDIPMDLKTTPFLIMKIILEKQKKNKFNIYKNVVDNSIIKKGTQFYRTANSNESLDSKSKYVSILLDDAEDYNYMAKEGGLNTVLNKPISNYTYTAKKDLKVATAKKIYDDIINKYGDVKIKDLYELTKDDYSETKNKVDRDSEIDEFVTSIALAKKEDLTKYYAKNYDAMVDMEDYASGYAEYPLILLKPIDSVDLYQEDLWNELYDD